MAMFLINCSGGKMDTTNKVSVPSIKDVPAEAWQKLAQKKIYFGHQSVGYNIIEGIKEVMMENPHIKLNIAETMKPVDLTMPVFSHSPVGQNMDPKSKCDVFTAFINAGLGERVDIAFFKFCYIDIVSNTDINRIFEYYKDTMSSLRAKYPRLIFIHTTSPLTTPQIGPRAWIKRLIGRPLGGYDDNIKREQFNVLIRKEYEGKEPIFDLAMIESTALDGVRSVFEKEGKRYPCMVQAYTTDGGHLNELGRKKVAEQLLIILTQLASQ